MEFLAFKDPAGQLDPWAHLACLANPVLATLVPLAFPGNQESLDCQEETELPGQSELLG